MPSIGEQFGNYRLLHLLGEGGFAQVYLGEHIHLGTFAAIKILNAQLTSQDVNTFRSEARIIARLIHPHIIRVLEFGIEGKTPFLVMDFARNGSLRHRDPKGTRLPASVVVSYVNQVADALQYAHDEKVIHRDVKPENMLIDQRNEILLSDFGIALIIHSSQYPSTQQITGTVAYMSPEQIQGKPVYASDQYSLGITVYEWLSGDRPFKGSFMEICTQHAVAQPPSLTAKVPTISPQVEMVVMKALAKYPKDRYPTIREFASDLEKASMPTQRVTPAVKSAPSRLPPPAPAQKPLQQASKPVKKTPVVNPQQSAAKATTSASQSAANLLSTIAANPKISRRKMVATGTGVLVIGAGAGGIYWLRSRNSSGHSTPIIGGSQTGKAIPGTTLFVYHANYSVDTVAWSPDGKRIASGGFNSISLHNGAQIWNATDGSHILNYTGYVYGAHVIAWSPDGKYIASGSEPDETIAQVWDATTGSPIFTYYGHTSVTVNGSFAAGVPAVAWSPNGMLVASGGVDSTVQLWHPITGVNVLTYRGHSSYVNTVAWSPYGKLIASGSSDKTVQVWNEADGSLVYKFLAIPLV